MKNRAYYENLRERMINEQVAYFLKGGDNEKENYDPFLEKNFAEFLANMPREDLVKLAGSCKLVRTSHKAVSYCQLLGIDLYGAATSYWKHCAKKEAERRIPSVEELEQQEAEYQETLRRC